MSTPVVVVPVLLVKWRCKIAHYFMASIAATPAVLLVVIVHPHDQSEASGQVERTGRCCLTHWLLSAASRRRCCALLHCHHRPCVAPPPFTIMAARAPIKAHVFSRAPPHDHQRFRSSS